MEVPESIRSLNRQLVVLFGVDTVTGDPMWRVSWSNDQREKKLMHYNSFGVELLTPQVLEVPKYPYIRDRYVLERLVVIPEVDKVELPATKLSYEPMWTFETDGAAYVAPTIDAAKFVIDTIYAAMGTKSLRKYVENEENTTVEGRDARVGKLQQELFGNETEVGDALRYKEGIVVPKNYEKES